MHLFLWSPIVSSISSILWINIIHYYRNVQGVKEKIGTERWFLDTALILLALYQIVQYQLNPLNGFGVMLHFFMFI